MALIGGAIATHLNITGSLFSPTTLPDNELGYRVNYRHVAVWPYAGRPPDGRRDHLFANGMPFICQPMAKVTLRESCVLDRIESQTIRQRFVK